MDVENITLTPKNDLSMTFTSGGKVDRHKGGRMNANVEIRISLGI